MTFAEVLLLFAGGFGIYFLLAPLQRRLERYLIAKLSPRYPRLRRTIDVTEFTSHQSSRKEDHQHEHRP
jgi:hypothetical protein